MQSKKKSTKPARRQLAIKVITETKQKDKLSHRTDVSQHPGITIQNLTKTLPNYYSLLKYHLTPSPTPDLFKRLLDVDFSWDEVSKLRVTDTPILLDLDHAVDNDTHFERFLSFLVFRILWAFHKHNDIAEDIKGMLDDVDDSFLDEKKDKPKTILKLSLALHISRALLEDDSEIVNAATGLMGEIWSIFVDKSQDTEYYLDHLKAKLSKIFDTSFFKRAVKTHFQALNRCLTKHETQSIIESCKHYTVTPIILSGMSRLGGLVLPNGIGIAISNLRKNLADEKATLAKIIICAINETGHFLLRNKEATKFSFSNETPLNQIVQGNQNLDQLEGGRLLEFILFGTFNHKIWTSSGLVNKLLDIENWAQASLFSNQEINNLPVRNINPKRSGIIPEPYY